MATSEVRFGGRLPVCPRYHKIICPPPHTCKTGSRRAVGDRPAQWPPTSRSGSERVLNQLRFPWQTFLPRIYCRCVLRVTEAICHCDIAVFPFSFSSSFRITKRSQLDTSSFCPAERSDLHEGRKGKKAKPAYERCNMSDRPRRRRFRPSYRAGVRLRACRDELSHFFLPRSVPFSSVLFFNP